MNIIHKDYEYFKTKTSAVDSRATRVCGGAFRNSKQIARRDISASKRELFFEGGSRLSEKAKFDFKGNLRKETKFRSTDVRVLLFFK